MSTGPYEYHSPVQPPISPPYASISTQNPEDSEEDVEEADANLPSFLLEEMKAFEESNKKALQNRQVLEAQAIEFRRPEREGQTFDHEKARRHQEEAFQLYNTFIATTNRNNAAILDNRSDLHTGDFQLNASNDCYCFSGSES